MAEEKKSATPNVWCVRAEFGRFTQHFVKGGYAAIGWIPNKDLSGVQTREALYPLYMRAYPNDKSRIVIGQQVGQIARFLLEIKTGDYIVTPASDTEWLHYGIVCKESPYHDTQSEDGCPYQNRRCVDWAENRLNRSSFSVPLQHTLRSSLTVFSISQKEEFFHVIGRKDLLPKVKLIQYDSYKVVLEQILELDPHELEILVGHLLTALGFEGSEVVGKTGDGGVDAVGELNVSNLAKVRVFVQVKRYRSDKRINASDIKKLRQAVPFGGQGAFITTADFGAKAVDVALEPGFPRIGLINGRQLVDLLIEHWSDIPQDFQERLGLKPGLVRG